jgi:hypothetical protein
MKFGEILLAAGLLLAAAVTAQGRSRLPRPLRYYVALNGSDAWSGRLPAPNRRRTDVPFATLERVRGGIRQLKANGGLPAGDVIVELRGGLYQREQPFELSEQDSGTETAPVIYRARPGEAVRLLGGKTVTGFRPVTDPRVRRRLDEGARGKVLQVDLRALGITDFGPVKGGGIELFFADGPMTVARWPNEGFVRIVDVVGGDLVDVRGTKGDRIGKFTYEGDRPKR